MKTNILSYITFGALMLGAFSSCSEDWTPAIDRTGQVDLRSMSIKVDSQQREQLNSRAEYDLKDYLVKIYDANNNKVADWRYADMPEIFTLKVGTGYRVEVASHEVQKAQWEAPLFVGSETFNIENAKITNIGTVKCTFSSMKVSVEFSDDLKKAAGDDVQVRVVANEEGELIFTPGEERAGYFEVVTGSNTIAYYFTGTVNGAQESFHHAFKDVKPGTYRKFKFTLSRNQTEPDVSTGTVTPGTGINVVSDVQEEQINGDMNVNEDNTSGERPKEDFGNNDDDNPTPPAPEDPSDDSITFTADMLKFGTIMNLTLDEDDNVYLDGNGEINGKVYIHVEKGIEHLYVNIQTDSEDFANILVDQEISTDFDMAHPTDSDAGVMSTLETTAEEILDRTDVTFDITQFIPLLTMFEGTHTFKITVVDKVGKSDSRTIIFKYVEQ